MSINHASDRPILTRNQITWTLIGAMLGVLLSSLDQTIVGTAMPRIVAELGGFNQYTWVTSIYMITSAIAVPIVGKLSDMYGRKLFYILGIVEFVVFSLACGLAQDMTQLIIFRGLQGLGGGILMSNSFTVIGDIFAPAERGKYQGVLNAVFGFSSVVGPTIGGFLTDHISWNWVFFVNVPLGAIIFFIFLKFFPDLRADRLKHRVDYLGVAFLILTVVPLMLALSWGGVEYAWGSPQILGLLVFTALALVLFLIIETRAAEPIFPLKLFKNRVVSISNLISFLTGVGMFGAVTFVPLFFQGVLGRSATVSGNMMIPLSMAVMAGSFIAGAWLARRGGRYRVQGITGTAIICVGVFLLTLLNVNSGYLLPIGFLIVLGIGMGLSMTVFTIAIQNAVPYNMLGAATSSSTFIRSLGGSVGLAILGSVVNNRFFSAFLNGLPESIRNSVPLEQITDLAHNPQALVSPAAQAQLQALFSQPDGSRAVYDQVMEVLRQSMSSAISQAFLVGFVILLVGLVATFFLRESPLKKANES